MTLDLDHLRSVGVAELTEWANSAELDSATADPNCWLAVISVCASTIVRTAPTMSADELSAALHGVDRVFAAAQRAGAVSPHEMAVRKLNLSAALLTATDGARSVAVLDPVTVAGIFLDTVPVTLAEARSAAPGWRQAAIARIRSLRAVRNLLTPMLVIRPFLPEGPDRAVIDEWVELLPSLP